MAGSIVVLVCVVGGFLMAGGNLLLLWHPSEIIVIVGSAFGAFITSNPLKVVKAAFTNALALFKKPHYDRDSYVDLLNLVFDLLVRARKEGMLAIEADVENPSASPIFGKYPAVVADHHMMEFITDCLRLMVGGNLDPNELESLLEYELDTHHKEAAEPAHAVQKVADALPGFGIVAAVLGIVNTMSAINGPIDEIGHHVAAALVGTFLGILIAYGFISPLAGKLTLLGQAEMCYLRSISSSLIGFANGAPPMMAVEIARRSLPSDMKPGSEEFEQMLKAAAK